jgi:ketosteroid isomerase-like protein
MGAGSLVRALYEAYQDRDWARAEQLLHPDAVLEMPDTAERLVGREAIIFFQCDYPEPWGILTVERVLADAFEEAAEVSVAHPSGRVFGLAAFWRPYDGLLHTGVEYWVTVGGTDPPPERSAPSATRAARQAWRDAHA